MNHMASFNDARSSWGGPPDMSAWEALMWRAEGDLRTRSSGLVVEMLDSEPDWNRLVAAHERVSLRIPRLRERVVEPLLPLVSPAWSPDPHFDLGYHLQRVRLPGKGSDDDLFTFAASVASRPLDPNRPQWEALLVSGLDGGRAAYLLKIHHSMTDGLGLLQLLDLTHGRSPIQEPPETTAMPARQKVVSPSSLLAQRLGERIVRAPAELVRGTAHLLGRIAADPLGITTNALRYGDSLRRVLASPDVERSPLLSEGGYGYHLLAHEVPLASLKAAGKAAGGSVNDAFLAALLGAVRRYHEHQGIEISHLPMAIPVSLRTDKDPMGGNKFAGARFVAPVGEPDPRRRIAAIHRFINDARAEPAIGFLDLIAPVLSRLPGPVLTELAGEMTGVSDLQASNLAGIGRTLYLAGARVTHVFPMGPRPGVAAMVTMVSYDGTCCIGVNLNPDAITDVTQFAQCLREGFDEVLALAQ